jgi:hypothetical protein
MRGIQQHFARLEFELPTKLGICSFAVSGMRLGYDMDGLRVVIELASILGCAYRPLTNLVLD